MSKLIPLCFLRLWCRRNEAWLSFKTGSRDRFLVNPKGYFIELPDGSLSAISPKVTFPLFERLPSVPLETLVIRKRYGDDAYFVSVPMVVPREVEPARVPVSTLLGDPLAGVERAGKIDRMEQLVLLRCLEVGLVSLSGMGKLAQLRAKHGTVGSALVYSGVASWETLLAACLDARPPSELDPPELRPVLEQREWELTGEILHVMGFISRTQLEYALKIKREGSQALGQILTAMGACSPEDLERALAIQEEIKQPSGSEVALIGRLLVGKGIITDEDLEEALRHQRIARQPLSRVLISMGVCTQRDIETYSRVTGLGFQSEVDDMDLGHFLVKTEIIRKIHLEEALRVQQRGRQVLGELLVSMGLCRRQDVDDALALQRDVRETARSGVEKLGSILISCGKVTPARLDEAVRLQSMGRQAFGAILLALGACTADEIGRALEIQEKWRQKPQGHGDRLGEVLVMQGLLSHEQLEAPLLQHRREGRPLGGILVERRLCTPEQVIRALIDRDQRRHFHFLEFVNACMAPRAASGPEGGGDESEIDQARRESLVNKLSTWFTRATGRGE